jgi:hypothetical protein
MSKQKQRLWLLSMLLIYIMIAVAGFTIAFVVKKYLMPSSTVPIAQVVKPVPSAHIPAGWKTYTNNDSQLQFAYPSTDKPVEKSYGFGVSSVILQTEKGQTDIQMLLLPKSLADTVGQNFDDYYTMPNNATKTIQNPISQDKTTETFTKIRNRTIDGNQALDYQSIATNARPGTKPEIGTFIQMGDNLVLISTDQNNKQELEKLLDTVTSL